MTAMRTFLSSRSGATAAEFAIVLPLLMILLFGIIDAGRYMWAMNRSQKAVQAGARHAIVTDTVPGGLQDYTFVSSTNPPGSPIPVDSFGSITCEATGGTPTCNCETNPCSTVMVGTTNVDAFGAIANRMRQFYPELSDSQIRLRYEGVGLGYAGNPHGSDVSPLVTVELRDATFQPITLLVFGAPQIGLPQFRSSMTLEDGLGTFSN